VRCHRVGTESGGEAGPNLAGAGGKYPREYLLESVVKPNAKIAAGFDTIVVTLKAGGIAAGIVASETADLLSLRDMENKLHEIKKADIAKREGAPSSMPEIFGAILTKSELRDVVEYLASLRDRSDRRPTTGSRAPSAASQRSKSVRFLMRKHGRAETRKAVCLGHNGPLWPAVSISIFRASALPRLRDYLPGI